MSSGLRKRRRGSELTDQRVESGTKICAKNRRENTGTGDFEVEGWVAGLGDKSTLTINLGKRYRWKQGGLVDFKQGGIGTNHQEFTLLQASKG